MSQETQSGLNTVPGLDLDLPEELKHICSNDDNCDDYLDSDFIAYWDDNDKFGELDRWRINNYTDVNQTSNCVMRFNAD